MGLGDELIQLAKGRQISNQELVDLFDELPAPHEGIPIIPRMTHQAGPATIKGRYLTFQFDQGWGQTTWCQERLWNVRQHHALFHHYKAKGFKMVDVGHRKFSLREIADLMQNSQGHVGICSGMGWLALACGIIPLIYYVTNARCPYLDNWKRWWAKNGVAVRYFDECFHLVPGGKAVDGMRYERQT